MTVYNGSRYEDKLLNIDKDGVRSLAIQNTTIPTDDSDYVIQFKIGDRLDILAKEFYGDSQLQWIILYANPQYSSPNDIKAGDYIVVPNIERLNINV